MAGSTRTAATVTGGSAAEEPGTKLRRRHRTVRVRIVDLRDEAPPRRPSPLYHDRYDRPHVLDDQRLVDVRKALHHHECKLLEGEPRAVRVNGRDRARMPAVDRAQVGKGLLAAQLAEQNAVGAQPQRRFAQILRADAGEALVAPRIEKAHRIALRGPQLARVLDHDEPLVRRNLLE